MLKEQFLKQVLGRDLIFHIIKNQTSKKIYGLDPSPELCEMAEKAAHNNEIKIDFLIEGDGRN